MALTNLVGCVKTEIYSMGDGIALTYWHYDSRREVWVVSERDPGVSRTGEVRDAKTLVIVTLAEDAEADNGLNNACLGCDLSIEGGMWLIDGESEEELAEVYGDDLEILGRFDEDGEVHAE